MAKKTLTDVFNDIANAIRSKGIAGKMMPVEMAERIMRIQPKDDEEDVTPPEEVPEETQYEWVKPDDWPDLKSIYNQYKDPNYKNAVIWLLDADELGFNNPESGVLANTIAPRTMKMPTYQCNPKQSQVNIQKVICSDGFEKTLTSADNKVWYHTFSGTDKYIWLMCMNNYSLEDGNYFGMQWNPEGSYEPFNLANLWIYGDNDSALTSGYNGPWRGQINLRAFEIGTLVKTNSITILNSMSLEQVKIGKIYSSSSAGLSSFIKGCNSLKHIKIGDVYPIGISSLGTIEFGTNPTLVKVELGDITIPFTSLQSTFSGNYLMESYPILDTSRCTSLQATFSTCKNLVALHEMDTSNVTDFKQMCSECFSLVEAPSILDLSKGTSNYRMFYNCNALSYIPDTLNMAVTTNTQEMFMNCVSLKRIKNITVGGSCTNMSSMFNGCANLVEISGRIDGSNTTTATNIFSGCKKLQKLDIGDLTFNKATSFNTMFLNCNALTSLPNITLPTTTNHTIQSMFQGCTNVEEPPQININSRCTSLYGTFRYMYKIKSLPQTMDVSKVTTASYMCDSCYNLEQIPTLNFQTISDCSNMFSSCSSLKDASMVTIPSTATTCASMFYNCYNLVHAPTSIDFSNATSTANMFSSCANLIDVPQNINSSKSTTCASMFSRCASLIQGPTTLNCSKATTIANLFNGCKKLKNLPDEMDLSSISTTGGLSDAFKNCFSVENLPSHFTAPTGNFTYTINFSTMYGLKNKQSIFDFFTNINDLSSKTSYTRTITLSKYIKPLFSDSEVTQLATLATSKGFTLTWG